MNSSNLFRILPLFLLLSAAPLASSQNDIRVPRIISTFDRPPKLDGPIKTEEDRVGSFDAGPPAQPIVVDPATAQKLDDLAIKYREVAQENYPMIVRLLHAENNYHPKTVHILITYSYNGVAATGGDTIHVSAKYAAAHPDDLGMIVHELTHVVQHSAQYGNDSVWLVEGSADWVRWFNYEPLSKRPHPNPATAHATDSYRTSAAFLDWAQRTYDKNLVPQLNQLLYTNSYKPDSWKELTGKSLDELNTMWIESLKPG